MANGLPTTPQLLNSIASGPPVGPIPTTPYAQTTPAVPPNVAPVFQPAPITGRAARPPYNPPRPGMQQGQGFGAGPTHSWMDQVRAQLGLGASPQQGMNMMGLPPQVQAWLMQMMMNPGALDPRGAQGGGGGQGMRSGLGGGTPGGWGGPGGLGGLGGTGTGGGAGGWAV